MAREPFDFDHCRVCGAEVSEAMRDWARRKIEDAHCGSPACTRKELVARFGCCELAEPSPCVCAYSFRCPIHGERHIGTHD